MSYEHVCAVGDLPRVGAALAEVDGRMVAMVRDSAGDVHAVADACSHGSVSLSEGEVAGCTLECWLHGSRFDLRTGRPLTPPATQPIDVYAVRVEGDQIYVDVTTTVNADAPDEGV